MDAISNVYKQTINVGWFFILDLYAVLCFPVLFAFFVCLVYPMLLLCLDFRFMIDSLGIL
jgi:hypothetical protein